MKRQRRGFNLIEMLIALAITAALMAATMVALDASFMAYQSTTEIASSHTVARLAIHRMQTLIRTGQDFGPFPTGPMDNLIASTDIEFLTQGGQLVVIEWVETPDAQHPEANALYVSVDGSSPQLLLGGVMPQFDAMNNQVMPFTLEYETGSRLHRATIDLLLVPDDNQSVELDGDNQQQLHLIATAMPRINAYATD